MKKSKTLLLSGMTLIAAGLPIIAAVSCTKPGYGASDGSGGGYFTNGITVKQTEFNIDDEDFLLSQDVISQSVSFLQSNTALFPILNSSDARTKIESLTPEDIRLFAAGALNDDEKVKLMTEIQAFVLHLFFTKNLDDSFNSGVASFLNNQAQAINSISGSRGMWLTDRSAGGSPIYIDPKYKRAVNDDGYESLQDSRIDAGSKSDLVMWNTSASTALDSRRADAAFESGNTFSSTEGVATTLPLIRTKVVGEDVFTPNSNGHGGSWTQTRSFEDVLEGADKIEIGGQEFSSLDDTAFQQKIEDPSIHELTFKIKPGTKYIDSRGNETSYELKGRDFFLGFMHQIYTSEPARMGELLDSEGIPALTESEIQSLKDEFGAAYEDVQNFNFYLYDLYNIDIKGTIDANEALTDAQKATDFVVKFKTNAPITMTGLQFFTNSNVVAPVSWDKVKQLSPNATISTPGEYFGVTTYLKRKVVDSRFDMSEWINVAPYYFTNYDLTNTTGSIKISKNTHYLKDDFVNANTLTSYEIKQKPASVDAAWPTARKDAFMKSQQTGELVLDLDATNSKVITDSITMSNPERKRMSKPYTANMVGNILWNPFGMDSYGYNDLGRQMMFGGAGKDGITGSAADAKNDFDAFVGFFEGNGPKTRAVIRSSINWFTIAQEYFPNQNKTYWQSIYGPDINVDGTNVISDVADKNYLKPSYTDDTQTLIDIYNNNPGSLDATLVTTKTVNAAIELDNIAKSVGATPENPAKIPYQFYDFTDTPSQQPIKLADKMVLAQLNKLTPRVEFVTAVPQTWSEFISTSRVNRTGTSLLGSFGVDYSGLGSVSQQYMTSYCGNAEVDFVYQVIKSIHPTTP